MKMKVINLTTGKNPPVVRVMSFTTRAVCYRLEDCFCEPEYDSSYHRVVNSYSSYSPNLVACNELRRRIKYKYTVDVPFNTARFKVYTENKLILEDFVQITNNKFKVIIPPLKEGYYYLDVFANGGHNRTMINVT